MRKEGAGYLHTRRRLVVPLASLSTRMHVCRSNAQSGVNVVGKRFTTEEENL